MTSRPFWTDVNPGYIRDCFNKVNQRELQRIEVGNHGNNPWNHHQAQQPINASRNRYYNVFPWDKNRVKLPVMEGGNDYINASYVKLSQDFKYIAGQGPLDHTMHHFWSMCFNEAVKRKEHDIIILMITPLMENNIIKCCQYWPDDISPVLEFNRQLADDKINLPSLRVQFINHHQLPQYTVTKLSLICGTTVKTVWHYHYHYWSDSRIPHDGQSLINLLNEVFQLKSTLNVKVPIVHCSAGVGRTGTFMALDYLNHNRSLLTKSMSMDPIVEILYKLRDDRIMMIQTVHQFKFLYDFFTDLLFNN